MGFSKEPRRLRQWLPWRYEWVYGEWKKPPFDPATGKRAEEWTKLKPCVSFEEAASKDGYDGVGFVVSADDPFVVIDLDAAIKDGEVRPWAAKIVSDFGSYSELSPSGNGLHVWLRGSKPGDRCRRDLEGGGRVEVYERGQFITFTGEVFLDRPIEARQEALTALYERLFPHRTGEASRRSELPGGFTGGDEDLLAKARKARGPFSKLFDYGDVSAYETDSEADNALIYLLAFWCGPDAARIERLMRRSALARGKWTSHQTYLRGTIEKAIAECSRFYDPNAGDYFREKRRSVANSVRERGSRELDPKSAEKTVLDLMLETAVAFGTLKGGEEEVGFNANQEWLAGEIGMTQRGVGLVIKRLCEKGFFARTMKGSRKRGNSTYLLKRVPGSSIMDNHSGGVSGVEPESSTMDISIIELPPTVEEYPPPVDIHYRTEGSTVEPAVQRVQVPFVESVEEVFVPSLDIHPAKCLCDGCLDRVEMPGRYVTYADGASGKRVKSRSKAAAA